MRKSVLLFLLICVSGFSQSINQYKYVIVPSKFSAQNSAGQFGLNNLTKMFMEKNGYTAFYDSDILPLEVSGESCNKIRLDVFEDNTMRTTRLKVEIKDCRNAVLFTSEYGESREKDNNVAYNQALRAAFRSFDKPEYRYNPSAEKAAPVKPVEAVAPAQQAQNPKAVETLAINRTDNFLSAQPIENGYQLIDTTPKIVLKMYKTSQPEVYIGESETSKGVVLKKDGQWVFEYYQQKLLVVKPLNIKF
jgi:hypothetical protein